MWIKFVNHYQEEISIYCSLPFHPKEQNTQSLFSEKIIEFLPSAPHPFRRQGADKTGSSSDPTLQILYYQPWKCGNVNIEENQKPTHGRSLERKKKKKKICKLCTVKNPALRKKVKRQHVNHAGRYVDLEASWT